MRHSTSYSLDVTEKQEPSLLPVVTLSPDHRAPQPLWGASTWHETSSDGPMVQLALQEAADDGTQATWGKHVTNDGCDP